MDKLKQELLGAIKGYIDEIVKPYAQEVSELKGKMASLVSENTRLKEQVSSIEKIKAINGKDGCDGKYRRVQAIFQSGSCRHGCHRGGMTTGHSAISEQAVDIDLSMHGCVKNRLDDLSSRPSKKRINKNLIVQ